MNFEILLFHIICDVYYECSTKFVLKALYTKRNYFVKVSGKKKKRNIRCSKIFLVSLQDRFFGVSINFMPQTLARYY